MPLLPCSVAWARRSESIPVDVEDPASLAAAVADTDVVLNATYMRHNVRVTDAAIAAGTHLVDLGVLLPRDAPAAGARPARRRRRVPGRAGLRCRPRSDEHPRPTRRRPARPGGRHPALLLHHPPHVDVAGDRSSLEFDASTGTSLAFKSGALVEYPSFSEAEQIAFPMPYGEQEVHIVPHPEPATIPRSIDVRNVVFKVGYPADETRRIKVLLELGFDDERPFRVDGVEVSPRRFAARWIGSRGSGRQTAVPTSSRSVSRASATDVTSPSSTISPSSRSAGPPRRRSPAPWPPSPRTSLRTAGRPVFIRRRVRSIRGRSWMRSPSEGSSSRRGSLVVASGPSPGRRPLRCPGKDKRRFVNLSTPIEARIARMDRVSARFDATFRVATGHRIAATGRYRPYGPGRARSQRPARLGGRILFFLEQQAAVAGRVAPRGTPAARPVRRRCGRRVATPSAVGRPTSPGRRSAGTCRGRSRHERPFRRVGHL